MATQTPTPRLSAASISLLSILAEWTNDGKFRLENRTVDAAPERIVIGETVFFLNDAEDSDERVQCWNYFRK